MRPHLGCGDVIYDEASNGTFHQKLESIQCNACIALSGANSRPSREKLCQELDLDPLQQRRWYWKLCLFYKIFTENKSVYLSNIMPKENWNYNSRNR